MFNLEVQVEGFIDDHFPGFVKCVLIDADGLRHEFIDKVPVVSTANLRSDSIYPQPGYLGCTIESEWTDELGRRLARVSTKKPWSIESVSGETIFIVREQQIVRT